MSRRARPSPRAIASRVLLVASLALILSAAFHGGQAAHADARNAAIERKVEALLQQMTLEEKIGQMTQFTGDGAVTGPSMRPGLVRDVRKGHVGSAFNVHSPEATRQLQEVAVKETRLHIPLLFGYDVIHGHRTIFPIPLAEACSWNMTVIERSARIAAQEASADGLHWTFAPMVDVGRDPRWGARGRRGRRGSVPGLAGRCRPRTRLPGSGPPATRARCWRA